jgi:hypothetical protein
MLKWKGCGKKWLWSVSRFCLSIHLEGQGKLQNPSVRIVCIPAEIQSELFSSISQKHYHMRQLAWYHLDLNKWCFSCHAKARVCKPWYVGLYKFTMNLTVTKHNDRSFVKSECNSDWQKQLFGFCCCCCVMVSRSYVVEMLQHLW